MPVVPEAIRLAVHAAATQLRERADSLRPDEELAASIAANAQAGDAFASAYAALRELGLTDKALDRFGVENATPAEMRQAADLLEQLATAEYVPKKRRKYKRMSEKTRREYRFAAVLFFLLANLFLGVFGAVFVRNGMSEFSKWRFDRGLAASAPAPAPQSPIESFVAPPLAPVDHGFERTRENRTVPTKPRDFVTDRAGILGEQPARMLNGRLMQFERETSNQLLVFIDRNIPPDTTLEELGAASIKHWGVGQKGKDNGVIFFVFVADRKMRVEVGYGLEGVLTDARSKRIQRQIVQPLFRAGKYAEGIDAGTRAIMDVTREGDAALERAEMVALASTTRRASIPLMLFHFAMVAGFLALMGLLLRSFILFLQGYQNGIFRIGRGRGSRGGGSDGSSSDSGGSGGGSSGSFSSGGGSGGGGGSSESW